MRSFVPILLALLCTAGKAQSLLSGISGTGGGGGGWIPTGLLTGLTGLAGALNTEDIERPRDFEPRGFFGFGLSSQMARLDHNTGDAEVATYPWLGGMAEAGVAVTWRERVGFSLSGGWGINGYLMRLDTVCSSVYHTSKRIELRTWMQQWPERNKERVFKFGLGYGVALQQADVVEREENGFRTFTIAPNAVRPYIAAEVGRISAHGKDRVELTVRYVVHLDDRNAWETRTELGTSAAGFSASDNYLALVTRYHIGVKRKALPPIPSPQLDFADRRTDTLTTLHTHQHRVVLRLWDDAEIDGDTISVFLNEVPVLSGHALTKKPLRLALDLRDGWNFLLVVAHNEGRVSPSTASCTVRRGKGKEELLIKTSSKHNQLVVFRCE